jgi:nucleoid DNA-binding protein
LIAEFAGSCNINRASADFYFKKLISIVRSNLEAGRHVKLEGLGVFGVHHWKARPGYDPIRKAKITVDARNGVQFKATKSLKDAVNGRPNAFKRPKD